MTRAAIYARKSTAQDDVADEAKSVTRQVEGARAFITKKRWSLDDVHVYVDDGISGAVFDRRPGFQQMMRDAEAGAFNAVVFADLDRLGRDGHRTMVALHDLERCDVEVWDYSTGQRVDLDSFETRLPTLLKAEFAQQYREQVSKHTKAAKRRSAEQGYVTGGKLFGYDNVRVGKGQTKRAVNEAEAKVVRTIYERFALGEGLRTIALALNRQKALSPRAQQGRASGWSASSVREVLARSTYRGTVVFGKTKGAKGRELRKVYPSSRREEGQVPTPEETWVVRSDESLRIVDADLAARVDARREEWQRRYEAGKSEGRRPQNAKGKYLLSGGMLLCPTCGGHFEAFKSPWNEGVYVCATRRRKPGTCSNTVALPLAETDNIVLDMIEGEMLGRRYIEELLALVDRGALVDETPRLTAERDKLRAEVNHLVASIAAGVPADTIAPAIRERERDIAKLEAEMRRPRPEQLDVERLRAALTQRAAEWKRDLRAEPQVARLLLRRLIGPIVLFEPAPDWMPEGREGVEDAGEVVMWEAPAKPGILEGLAPIQVLASPTGLEQLGTVPLRGHSGRRRAA